MKKKLSVIVIATALLILCLSLFACSPESDDTESGAYSYTIVRTVGTYSGYRVDVVIVNPGSNVNAALYDYYVDGLYIHTFPYPSYDYYVFITEDEYVNLITAYEQGLVTYDDLLAIAEDESADGPYND